MKLFFFFFFVLLGIRYRGPETAVGVHLTVPGRAVKTEIGNVWKIYLATRSRTERVLRERSSTNTFLLRSNGGLIENDRRVIFPA